MARPRRGEIWWVDLTPSRGDEIGKTRPAVVLSADELGALAVKLVVPLTTHGPKKVGKGWLVPVKATAANGLPHDSVADVLQLRGVSLGRLRNRIGAVSDDDLSEIAAAVTLVIGVE